MENQWSFCPKCNQLNQWRFDITHCTVCKTKMHDFPTITEENEELIELKMEELRQPFIWKD